MAFTRWRAGALTKRVLPIACTLVFSAAPFASASSLTVKDVRIIAKALGSLDPASSSGAIAVVYADPASKLDADAIVSSFGGGLPSSTGTITAVAADAAGLHDGKVYIPIILASCAPPANAVSALSKSRHIPCIAADLALVQSGICIMAVIPEPRVSITVSHAATQAAGIEFASAFAMPIHEI